MEEGENLSAKYQRLQIPAQSETCMNGDENIHEVRNVKQLFEGGLGVVETVH